MAPLLPKRSIIAIIPYRFQTATAAPLVPGAREVCLMRRDMKALFARCGDHSPMEMLRCEFLERNKQASIFEERRCGSCIGHSEREFGENSGWTRTRQRPGERGGCCARKFYAQVCDRKVGTCEPAAGDAFEQSFLLRKYAAYRCHALWNGTLDTAIERLRRAMVLPCGRREDRGYPVYTSAQPLA